MRIDRKLKRIDRKLKEDAEKAAAEDERSLAGAQARSCHQKSYRAPSIGSM